MAAATITEHEAEQVEKANATGKQPVGSSWHPVCDTALKFVQRFV